MKQLAKLVISILLGVQIGCDEPSPLEDTTEISVQFVSMVELITDPSRFDGQSIEVFGYYGGRAPADLFLTKDHAVGGDPDSSVRVMDESAGEMSRSCSGHYVRIRGKLGRYSAGSRLPSFQVGDVVSVTIVDHGPPTACWSKGKRIEH
jgi:hypothetical protein